MPAVICAYCCEIFTGLSIQDAWDKARKHEDEKHQRDLQEAEAGAHD